MMKSTRLKKLFKNINKTVSKEKMEMHQYRK